MYEDIHMALCRGRKCINASHCMVSGATCLHTHPALDYFMTHSIHAYESMVASTAAATVSVLARCDRISVSKYRVHCSKLILTFAVSF